MTDLDSGGRRNPFRKREMGVEDSSLDAHKESDDENLSKDMSNKLALFKNKMKDGKRAIVRLKCQQEDAQLDTILSDLMLLESHLHKEQSHILAKLANRDSTISAQRQEIERLRRDNRRLISRLKKITEGREAREDKPNNNESNIDKNDYKIQSKKSSSKTTSKRSPEPHNQTFTNRPFIKQSVMTSLTSQFYEKSALQFTDENGKIVDRVMHKPPIAEKPKFNVARASHRPVTAILRRNPAGPCNIVSTISRLLEEESDQGINGSSGSSEPSSPEATLKPTTPRVIRLARQYEKSIVTVGGCSSSESGRSGDEQSIKAMIMDEHEVTSGYNSDAVSDQDHDYENIVLFKGKISSIPTHQSDENSVDLIEDSEDNYVILRAVRHDYDNSLLLENPEEDQHIYSNIEYGVKEDPDELAEMYIEELELHDQFPSDVPIYEKSHELENEGSENAKSQKNVPRSRHNISLVMGPKESHLMDNFEEFTLDSLDLEDLHRDDTKGKENLPLLNLRHSGDGAEAKDTSGKEGKSSTPGQGGYERFLEVTGLSQKSILTPSRMFSNHRSVLKPRDIKHRDKLRAAFTSLSSLEEVTVPSGDSTNASSTSQPPTSSSQRYWREPYL